MSAQFRRLEPRYYEAERRLIEFGHWCRAANRIPNDWPTTTVLGRVIEAGLDGAAQGSAKPTTRIPPEHEILDRHIAKVWGIRRAVFFIRYVYCPHESEQQQRRKLNMSHTRWSNELRMLRDNIALALAE